MGIVILDKPKSGFKTSGITHDEWLSLFTETELISLHKAKAQIDGDLTWITGNSVAPDEKASALGFAEFTYRDLLRTSFQEFDYAPSVNVNDSRTPNALFLLRSFGILKSDDRIATMLQGVPLS